MKQECTDLFFRYREIARLIWNLGFWPNSELRDWDSVEIYREATARLFEGLVLLALDRKERVKDKYYPGKAANFLVLAKGPDVKLQVDKHPPGNPVHVWGQPVLRLGPDSSQLKFLSFFDWDNLAPRNFQLLEVLIQRLDDNPSLVGHHALIELEKCSIWLAPDVFEEKQSPE